MDRRWRRRAARSNLGFWAAATLPGTWFIPLLGDIWFQRATLFLCFIGLVLPAADIDQTTQVRDENAAGA